MIAPVAELVDAAALKADAERRAGSNPAGCKEQMMDVERLAREAGAEYEMEGSEEPECGGLMFWDEGGFRKSEYPSLHRFADAVRREALEEAALVCDAEEFREPGYVLASRIRALIDAKPEQ